MAANVRAGDHSEELTIFAVSSGVAPAAIGIIRLSGSRAFEAGAALCGKLPSPREARVRALRDPGTGMVLDRAIVIVFPAETSATGEDLVEFHCHGGRAVLAAVETALGRLSGCRRAVAGEFTRRALRHGRTDLAQAEALGDLLAAETESQRRHAQAGLDGALSRAVSRWQGVLLHQAALIEAALAFEDEEEVASGPAFDRTALAAVLAEIDAMLASPPAERLRDGVRVVLAGPPNAGKSTLLNAMVGRDAAIVSSIAGTTRDRIEVPVQHNGVAYLLIDTAGLRNAPSDEIEQVGIARTRDAMMAADVVIWMGDDEPADHDAVAIWPRCDLPGRSASNRLSVSATTGAGVEELWRILEVRAAALLPREYEVALNARQRTHLADAAVGLRHSMMQDDAILAAEELRRALVAFDRITGRAHVEAVLDGLFANFCLGK